MAEVLTDEFVTYDLDGVPSEGSLKQKLRLGTALIWAGIASVVALIWWFASSLGGYYNHEVGSFYYYDEFGTMVLKSSPTGWHWLIPLGLIVAGCILRTIAKDRYFDNYRYVDQGEIIQKDNYGGSFFEGLQWTITIKGNTRGNVMRYYTHHVPAGDWHEYKNGQFVDFR